MKNFLAGLKDKFGKSTDYDGSGEDYLPLEEAREEKGKVMVQPFVMEDFDDVKVVLDSLREGRTIALINIRPLKEKDMVELKRAINKLRKTCDAIEGDIAGMGEDWIVVTPSFAHIYRNTQTEEVSHSHRGEF